MSPIAPPTTVRAAHALWMTAVAAGVFETVLSISRMPVDGRAADVIGVGLAFRLAVFTAAVLTTLRMRAGAHWARLALALGLGILGTASLVVEPLGYLLDGGSIASAAERADGGARIFAASRAVHVAAVLTAVFLMFRPASNAWFRGRGRALSRNSA
ncbi:hypothetical protein ACFWBH_07280 [Streptomyces sp. NPDC059999]|uniref:hypothetical protein n=1 Tax=Streptomyces sp. NPDC059999 TaxID=3347030 RepID=UPI0036C21C09